MIKAACSISPGIAASCASVRHRCLVWPVTTGSALSRSRVPFVFAKPRSHAEIQDGAINGHRLPVDERQSAVRPDDEVVGEHIAMTDDRLITEAVLMGLDLGQTVLLPRKPCFFRGSSPGRRR